MYRKLFTIGLAFLITLFAMTMADVANAQDKITGPWLWMIAPTAANEGGANSTDVDSLAEAVVVMSLRTMSQQTVPAKATLSVTWYGRSARLPIPAATTSMISSMRSAWVKAMSTTIRLMHSSRLNPLLIRAAWI